jgi:hypothetical protein
MKKSRTCRAYLLVLPGVGMQDRHLVVDRNLDLPAAHARLGAPGAALGLEPQLGEALDVEVVDGGRDLAGQHVHVVVGGVHPVRDLWDISVRNESLFGLLIGVRAANNGDV